MNLKNRDLLIGIIIGVAVILLIQFIVQTIRKRNCDDITVGEN